ncbi:MAG: hypothetical protein IKY26_07610 [Erysipelotrichaceae bacterium]|nr:hypothetical protein [Erysipelotrichaceae bacterium]
MGKHTWTKEQEEYLEYLYSQYTTLDKVVEEINKLFGINRTITAISNKAAKLGLTSKYVKPNSTKFKAIYQNYDWYYECFVERGLNHEQMAELANCTKRVIEKWGQEKHHIDTYTRMKNKQFDTMQHDLIIGSLLGDGHIDKREEFPLFIVSHAENQKDYLCYKYTIMKNLCEMTPTKYEGKKQYKIVNSVCDCQDFYRFNTRTYYAFKPFREMSKIDLINQLNEYSFSIWMLDDGSCVDKGYWELCAPLKSDNERSLLISILFNKFGITAIEQKDNRYFKFHSEDSFKITKMILDNIPNNLDIVQDKILNKKKYMLLGGDKS